MQTQDFQNLKQGKPIALEHLYQKYNRMLFWLGKQLIRDEFVIETLVQESFLKLWKHRETLETPEHIFFFLRYVMKRECTYYYCRPKNKFNRSINRLSFYGNYEDYMLGHDPVAEEDEHLLEQEATQQAFEQVKKVLPYLSAERSRLIELCITYGFRYKAIAEVMGKGITETANEVKRAIAELKTILQQDNALERQQNSGETIKLEGEMTTAQAKVFQLRCEEAYSFARIAEELNCSQKEAQQEFMTAYSFMQQQHEQQTNSFGASLQGIR
ncbi:RNA polymerase sigma factor [Mesonia maritima]|uniref:RNA polymerase sigma factor (Sigma-70 family) n=1 Tax=Mesonia maritima TaxID=1793873 RepID=A0ABU1K4Y4_9FLAO|nr:sigma-70 family RNA polymerase sigma factor [Mesonia maritima]MDR6300675.1 RNA polymerase sigma factor (sigma-70 family) [Mesonia maritima]